MVALGMRLRELLRHRAGVIVSVGLALSVAGASAGGVSLFSPGMPRNVQPAGEHTQLLVDDRGVSVLRSGFDMASFNYLHQGAMLAATLLAQDPGRDYVARLAGIPVGEIHFSAPQTVIDPPLAPWPATRYTVTVAARSTVPVLDVYVRAPTRAGALRLVDAAAPALNQTLTGRGSFGLSVTQLGSGAPVQPQAGGSVTTALELFLVILALGFSVTVIRARARGDWRPSPTVDDVRRMSLAADRMPAG